MKSAGDKLNNSLKVFCQNNYQIWESNKKNKLAKNDEMRHKSVFSLFYVTIIISHLISYSNVQAKTSMKHKLW